MQTVPPDVWNLDAIQEDDRRRLLLCSLSPKDVLDWVDTEARKAIADIALRWVESGDRAGVWRVEADVPLHKMTFDLFFNGRMGYRAQYYLSIDEGRRFNAHVVERIAPVLHDAASASFLPVGWETIEKSWNGPHSAVWMAGDRSDMVEEPKVLRPERWVKYWETSKTVPLGLAAPRPDAPMLALKGGFVALPGNESWVPVCDRDRDAAISRSGWV